MRYPKPHVHRYGSSKTPGTAWVVEGLRDMRGKRYRKFFRTQVDATTWLEKEQTKVANEGRSAHLLTDAQRVDAIRAFKVLKDWPDVLLTDAATHFRRHLETVRTSRSIIEAKDAFLASRDAEGARKRHMQDLRSRLDRFCGDFSDRKVAEITVTEVEHWLAALGLSPQSRRNFHNVLRSFFNYCRGRKWCPENPLDEIKKPRVAARAVPIFEPSELRRLLIEADPAIVPELVIGAFAGLRASEIDRLDWKQIRLDLGHIDLSAAVTKTAKRRLVAITDNLAQWLTPHVQRSGPVRSESSRRLMREAIKATGSPPDVVPVVAPVEWKQNGLRHSFASYHLAAFQDASKTALQLGHASASTLFQHYNGVATREAANEWFEIRPSNAAAKVVKFG